MRGETHTHTHTGHLWIFTPGNNTKKNIEKREAYPSSTTVSLYNGGPVGNLTSSFPLYFFDAVRYIVHYTGPIYLKPGPFSFNYFLFSPLLSCTPSFS